MGSRDEDFFMSTQQQEDDGVTGDDVYLELEKAITERKCRIVQKKEKIKLIINEMKKQNEMMKSATKEQKRLKEEAEEVAIQKNLRVQNLKKAQESRAALESTLCELNNKLPLVKAETQLKKEEYDAAIKNAYETLESYKEQYENFPLAKKLRQVKTEVKKLEDDINQAKMDVADYKSKTKLKQNIAEKRFHEEMVKLAKKYKEYQRKIEEQKDLQNKIKEVKKVIADLKSGKATEHQLELSTITAKRDLSNKHPSVRSTPEKLDFTVTKVQLAVIYPNTVRNKGVSGEQQLGVLVNCKAFNVTSPPPSSTNENESSSGGRQLFSWDNLLRPTELLGLSKRNDKKNENMLANASNSWSASTTTVSNVLSKSPKEKSPYNSKRVGSSLSLANLLRRVSKSSPGKQGMAVGNKRNSVNTPGYEERPPSKKVCTVRLESTLAPELVNSNNKVANEKTLQGMVIKDLAGGKSSNNENTNPNNLSNISSLVRDDKSETGLTRSRAMNQNLMNKLSSQGSANQKSSESLKKVVQEQANNKQVTSVDDAKKYTQHDQQKSSGQEYFLKTNIGRQHKQFEDTGMLLEPRSPAPDLIPVETNSQPLSQGNEARNCSPINFNLSGESDFTSPGDCDEATKAVYARIESEGPYLMAGNTQGNTITQKQTSKANVVRSEYFADTNTLNTPHDASADYQSSMQQMYLPLSPPPGEELGYGNINSPQLLDNIQSPPPANTDAVGAAVAPKTTINSGFNFFMSGAAPKDSSSKTIFDFF